MISPSLELYPALLLHLLVNAPGDVEPLEGGGYRLSLELSEELFEALAAYEYALTGPPEVSL